MDKALVLIGLQKQALAAKGLEEAIFLITNKTHQLINYHQAIFFSAQSGSIRAKAVSGNATIEPKGTHTYIVEKIIKNKLSNNLGSDESKVINIDNNKDIAANDLENWKSFASPHNILLIFTTEDEGHLGSLLVQRDKAFDEAEMAILEELQLGYSNALALHNLRETKSLRSSIFANTRHRKWLWIGFIILCFMPVRLSITAPAEIIAEEAKMVSAPFDGMIDNVLIKPGDIVEAGNILARMDQDSLKTREQAAAQAVELAKVSLSRVRREALSAPEKKAELNKLQAEIKTKTIEYEYAKTLLERSEISTPQDGIAIFPSVNTLRGKPVVMGEKLMLVANPDAKELLIRVPVDAMLDFDENAEVSFFSSVAPLTSYKGQVISTGYQASVDPDGLLTYKVLAQVEENQNLRIGWKGTAKIYDEWSVLSYAVLRRPLIALRNIIGL